jgi:hypothetical protein
MIIFLRKLKSWGKLLWDTLYIVVKVVLTNTM